MDRTKFYKVQTVDGVDQLDFLWNNLSNFSPVYEGGLYRVRERDKGRPDLISYYTYGDVGYWWMVCFMNAIDDPFNQMNTADLLTIPNVVDIIEFYRKFRLR